MTIRPVARRASHRRGLRQGLPGVWARAAVDVKAILMHDATMYVIYTKYTGWRQNDFDIYA